MTTRFSDELLDEEEVIDHTGEGFIHIALAVDADKTLVYHAHPSCLERNQKKVQEQAARFPHQHQRGERTATDWVRVDGPIDAPCVATQCWLCPIASNIPTDMAQVDEEIMIKTQREYVVARDYLAQQGWPIPE